MLQALFKGLSQSNMNKDVEIGAVAVLILYVATIVEAPYVISGAPQGSTILTLKVTLPTLVEP